MKGKNQHKVSKSHSGRKPINERGNCEPTVMPHVTREGIKAAAAALSHTAAPSSTSASIERPLIDLHTDLQQTAETSVAASNTALAFLSENSPVAGKTNETPVSPVTPANPTGRMSTHNHVSMHEKKEEVGAPYDDSNVRNINELETVPASIKTGEAKEQSNITLIELKEALDEPVAARTEEPRGYFSPSSSTQEFKENSNEETSEEHAQKENYGLSTTVYVAVPKTPFTIAITGEDHNLGCWKERRGKFELFRTIGEIVIYKGTIPTPSVERTSFKFVQVNPAGKMLYEGDGSRDDRNEELLPDSINFFIFKPPPEGVVRSVLNIMKNVVLPPPKTERKVISEFIKIVYDRALQDIGQSWDASFDTLLDGLEKIRRERRDNLHESFNQYIDQQLNFEDKRNDLNWILLLFAGAAIISYKSQTLIKLIENNVKQFSLFLFNGGRNIKRHRQEYDKILESISSYVPGLAWIMIRQNRTENLKKTEAVSKALIMTLNEMEEVLHDNNSILHVERTIGYLVKHNKIDYLYTELEPFFNKNNNNREQIDAAVLNHLRQFKGNYEKTIEILRSEFLMQVYQRIQAFQTASGYKKIPPDYLNKFLFAMLDLDLQPLFVMGGYIPDCIRPLCNPIVETLAANKLQKIQRFNQNDFKFFGKLDINALNYYPQTRSKIELMLLRMTEELVSEGSFSKIPSTLLLLHALSRREDIYLQRPDVTDLQKILVDQPRHFFAGLSSALHANDLSVEQTLKPYRNSKLKLLCDKLQDHFDHIEQILCDVKESNVPLNAIRNYLLDPRVIDCLKVSGAQEDDLIYIRSNYGEVRDRYQRYSNLYTKLARFETAKATDQDEGEADEEASEEEQEHEDDRNEPESKMEIHEVFDDSEWESYLKSIEPDASTLTLKAALFKTPPISTKQAQWLEQITKSKLFMERVWLRQVEDMDSGNLSGEDLADFISDAAQAWMKLAESVNSGVVPFSEMEIIIDMEPDTTMLSRGHLGSGGPFLLVQTGYRDFRNLLNIRHLITPFVTALRFFNIRDRSTIDKLHQFVTSKLVNNWKGITLEEVARMGIINTIDKELAIDSERPETLIPIQFVASLVTDEGASPLIEWLRTKKEQDFEAMGKILDGTLFEAYGQLQTLKTRIAPFLIQPFNTYQDLLRAIRESEKKFAQRHSGRVQEVKTEWLTSMLPEIEAAIRASTISPSEDAKEKLQRLSSIHIAFDAENYSIKVRLTAGGDLSMEELKQAFQLLDMAASDGGEQLVSTIRTHVERIVRLAEVFDALYISRFIAHTFNNKEGDISINMPDLMERLNEMQRQLKEWNAYWVQVSNLPYLAICSRDFLLYLANAFSQNNTSKALGFLRMLLPSAPQRFDSAVGALTREFQRTTKQSKTAQLFDLLSQLDSIIKEVFQAKAQEIELPPFLNSYGQMLETHFLGRPIVILNVPRQLLVGSSLAAYVSLTRRPVKPTRIFFVTANTRQDEIERFMRLWSVGEIHDLFIIVHVERLPPASATSIRDAITRVLPEQRARLLLLAQQHHRTQSTKSLGARLGLQSDRLLEIKFSADQLRECFTKLSPITANIHFYTSSLPGCGKSQQAMKLAAKKKLPYSRIAVREGTVEELMRKLKNLSSKFETVAKESFLHLDVAHSVSLEFNDILLSLILHGALYDPRKSHLGFWRLSPKITIAVEFSSPYDGDDFPIISYLGTHHKCECSQGNFSHQLAVMPSSSGKLVQVEDSSELIAAAKFLELQQNGQAGLAEWHILCSEPELMLRNPLPKQKAFQLLLEAFESEDNRNHPTFSAIKSMATFLHRHITAMLQSLWFNSSAKMIFGDCERLASIFKLDIFRLLIKVANDSLSRCWSLVRNTQKKVDFDWLNRQRAMLLLGMDEYGHVMGVNVVGRHMKDLQAMFHADVRPYLRYQSLHFQELNGFRSLTDSKEGTETILNAIRSLLQLDGSPTNLAKARQLDDHPRHTPPLERLRAMLDKDLGYVLTGDNITKMMFALYRIRCGLPVILFGEAGVGKSALFRFLIQTLLGHHFSVCNVNSGTSIQDISQMIEGARTALANGQERAFVLLDEMNTSDPSVIAFLKELMLDRSFEGETLPENLHLIGAANPYRMLKQSDADASVGLAFRFAESKGSATMNRDLVYRVNELPRAFYDHIYDFGYLSPDAENVYIEEIGHHSLAKDYDSHEVKKLVLLLQKSHREARRLSPDPESAVSLRDATRGIQLFEWFTKTTIGKQLARNHEIAMELAIFLVYAFRFTARKQFLESVFGKFNRVQLHMKQASKTIAEKLYKHAHGASIGSGAVALNDALCENLFGLFVCVLNGIFVIIVGRPGTSKSLSVEILKLVLSPGNHKLRENLGDLPALTELYFQCSPLSTSAGFKALFESAQRLSVDPKTMLAMVVLDELGLADLSPEKPIKVLHSELERKAFLTSGETQQSPYSVVALSNWVVDAAQVNRGILISRKQANKEDLLTSAKELAESLIKKLMEKGSVSRINDSLSSHLECIVEMYHELDRNVCIGGGHFYSMRDFFFCVKNFVCSVFDGWGAQALGNIHVSDNVLIQSVVRNFGGHEKAKQALKHCLAYNMSISEKAISMAPVLDLVIQNIQDSAKKLSVHIARHLMILNRCLIGLQLLNRHVKNRLDDGTAWTVLFGSCFPGDLRVTAVTRKLRQVEQAIRKGGVLVLCHADQLFESLYMVLNQQYWAQGDVTMTQIALGPSIRAIALPDGPFRIIALQDTDVALNRQQMSPAVLSRFEKHELRPHNLLNEHGRKVLSDIETHPVWSTMSDVRRRQLLFGYHEDTLASLALQLQDLGEGMEVDFESADESWARQRQAHGDIILMRAVNPMAMIKLERDGEATNTCTNMLPVCQLYRKGFIMEGLDDVLKQNPNSNRFVIMTNSLRHVDVLPRDTRRPHLIIPLFDIHSELELDSLLNSLKPDQLQDPNFCLIVQYDAISGPIEQFQLTKYEIDVRLSKANCQVVFTVHLDPRSVYNRWVFSFGDGWEYVFVDELAAQPGHTRLPLKALVEIPGDRPLTDFVRDMTLDRFRDLLLEMLGPVLQTCLENLGAKMGAFFGGVRKALQLPQAEKIIQLLKECLVAQLDECKVTWNVLNAVTDAHFDSSSSLTEGLWEVFKQKISKPLAHLLLMGDVWRLNNPDDISMWCAFVTENFPDRLMVMNSTTALLQVPVGLRSCKQPFGRLLALFDKSYSDSSESKLTGLLSWLLKYVAKADGSRTDKLRQAYFCDWISLHLPAHLHPLVGQLPLSKMPTIIDNMFEEPEQFFTEWLECESEVIAALEHGNLASFASSETNRSTRDVTKRMRNWRQFIDSTVRQSLMHLDSPDALNKRDSFVQAVTSIELSQAMQSVIERSRDMSDLWLKVRITKRMFLFDPDCDEKLYDLQDSSPENVIQCLTDLVVGSVIRPRAIPDIDQERLVRRADLLELLNSTASCDTIDSLASVIQQCPNSNSLLVVKEEDAQEGRRCSRCNEPLVSPTPDEATPVIRHLRNPRLETVDSLFQDYNKFMLLFEQVAELFIEHKRNSPGDIRDFLGKILASSCKLRISWRFFTVIVRSVLNNRTGNNIIDRYLETISCNRPSKALSFNAANFLRALLVCADEDVRREIEFEVTPRWRDAMMTDDWSVARIRRLAEIRRVLTENEDDTLFDAMDEWAERLRNEDDARVLEGYLFFLLRFGSREGDQTRLNAIFSHKRAPEELNRHAIISEFKETFTPMALGFPLQPANGRVTEMQEMLKKGQPMHTVLHQYDLLVGLTAQWAPYIARLAIHATDVVHSKGVDYLYALASNPVRAANLFLPGVDNHPYLASYRTGEGRWYVCDCQTLCWVLNCGQPTLQSFCGGCNRALAVVQYTARPGVRLAAAVDFGPPRGLHVGRNPALNPTYSVRELNPAVTRLALLLNSLCLLYGTLSANMNDVTAQQLMQTLPLTERINRNGQADNRQSLSQLLVQHVLVNLEILCKLLVTRTLTTPDQFRIGHLLLHKVLETADPRLTSKGLPGFEESIDAREEFERALDRLLTAQANLGAELDRIDGQADEASKNFQRAVKNNEQSYWIYARQTSSSRETVQLALARDVNLKNQLPFLNLLVDDEQWAPKLDALIHLGDAVRFVAVVRSTLQGKLSKEEADIMTIANGIEKIIEILEEGAVILDRGRPVATGEQVRKLFFGFQQLWNCFSQIPNSEHKTFLEFFECQQVDVRVRPNALLRETAPLILILAGNNSPEMTFSCQLLANAVEAANSLAQIDFIKMHCRKGSSRTRLNCSSAAGMAEFDESLYSHVSREQVDRFIVDHVIDNNTLRLAESFAMVSVLGSAGSTIAADLFLDPIPEFTFKETTSSENHVLSLERRFSTWQPTTLTNEIVELILADLEKNRCLGEAKSLLISVLSHLLSNTEPLVISKVRKTYVTDVLEELVRTGILTEQHVSSLTLDAFNRHIRLQVHQALGLLKSVFRRMKGDDLFGGRIQPGWDVMMPERLIRETTEMMRAHAENDIRTTLLDIANVISSSQSVPHELSPDNQLLKAVRIYEGEGWQGIPADLTLANLGHALLIAEGL